MDAEWKPKFTSGEENKISVLQLANEHTVVLFRPMMAGDNSFCVISLFQEFIRK
jgi:hypothetical protein